jgi:hypothetical protein
MMALLVPGDEVFHERGEPARHHLCYNPDNGMDQSPRHRLSLEPRQNSSVGPMENFRMQLREQAYDLHDLDLDDAPSRFEKRFGKPIRTGRLIARHRLDHSKDLLLGEVASKGTKVTLLELHARSEKVYCTGRPSLHITSEMSGNNCLFLLVICKPPWTIAIRRRMKFFLLVELNLLWEYLVLASPCSPSRTVFFRRSLQDHISNDAAFEMCTQLLPFVQ